MPLRITTNLADAERIFDLGVAVDPSYQVDIGMGSFGVSECPQTTALATGGAGPCQIIIVHKAPGVGALGHYGANTAAKIVQGVQLMVEKLGGSPIANIVFAGGDIGGVQEQQQYEHDILSQVRGRYPEATITWPPPPHNSVYDAAYYLPWEEQIALLQDSIGNFTMKRSDKANCFNIWDYRG